MSEAESRAEQSVCVPANVKINVDDQDYFDSIFAFAVSLGGERLESLQKSLEQISRIQKNCGGRAELYRDFAPQSFGWSAGGMAGGCIFHGAHDGGGDGGAPTFSVSLTAQNGWALHS